MFLEVHGTLQSIGDQVGVTPQTVSNWRTGHHAPPPRWRGPIYSAFGIPEIAWSRRPGGTLELPPGELEPAGASLSTLEDCKALADTIRRDRLQEGLLPTERVKLADAEARILALKNKLEQSAELSEARYVLDHPAWVRLRKVILKALEPFPAAAKAVTEAIGTMERLP